MSDRHFLLIDIIMFHFWSAWEILYTFSSVKIWLSSYISALNKHVVIGSNEKFIQPLWGACRNEVMMQMGKIREFITRMRQRWINAKIKKLVTLYGFFFFHRFALIHLGIFPIIFRDLTHFLDDTWETLHCQDLVNSERKLWRTPVLFFFLYCPTM